MTQAASGDEPAPQGRLWGGRFGDAPDDAAWRLGRSVGFDARLWRDDIAGSRAHAAELARIGLLGDADHAAITDALDRIEEEFSGGRFAFGDGDEDLHGAIERRLVELTGEAGGRLRAGRSRNDQIASDLRRYLRRIIADELLPALRGLQAALVDQAEATVMWVVPGYTHLQRAQPVTLGHHLLAHAWALDRDAERLADAARRMDSSTLGAGALAGTTLPLDPERYAQALGFAHVAPNSMDAVSSRDFAAEFCAASALCGIHLSRLAEDIVLWCSAEFGWARVSDAFSTGSSIMPQKRNPDVAELARGKSGRLIGNLNALLVTLKGLPLTYNRDLQEDKEPVFDTVDTLGLVLPALAGTVRSLLFDQDRIEVGASGGFALATDVAEALVQSGVPFREAHERVGRVVARCEELGVDLGELPTGEQEALLPELHDLGDLLDPVAAVARRDAVFGPAPSRVRAQIAALRERLG